MLFQPVICFQFRHVTNSNCKYLAYYIGLERTLFG